VDGTGFEPAASTMPRVSEKVLQDFKDFLLENMRLEQSTVKNTIQDARRFLVKSDYTVSYENVKHYLEGYIHKAAKTYNSQITSLRRFIRDFLKLDDLIMSFKMAPWMNADTTKICPTRNKCGRVSMV
jgi:hypothetical protein